MDIVNRELAQILARCRDIISELLNVESQINSTQESIRNLQFMASNQRMATEAQRRKEKEPGKLSTKIRVIIFILTLLTIGNGLGKFLTRFTVGFLMLADVPVDNFFTAGRYNGIVWIVSVLCSIPLARLIRLIIERIWKSDSKNIERRNREVDRQLREEQQNAMRQLRDMQELADSLSARMEQLWEMYDKYVVEWIPDQLRSPEIIDQLLQYVQNGRAGDIHEAIKIYYADKREDEHFRRLEQNQINQQWMELANSIMSEQRHREMMNEMDNLRGEISDLNHQMSNIINEYYYNNR